MEITKDTKILDILDRNNLYRWIGKVNINTNLNLYFIDTEYPDIKREDRIIPIDRQMFNALKKQIDIHPNRFKFVDTNFLVEDLSYFKIYDFEHKNIESKYCNIL